MQQFSHMYAGVCVYESLNIVQYEYLQKKYCRIISFNASTIFTPNAVH